MKKNRIVIFICWVIAALTHSMPTYSAEYEAAVRAGVGVSDNIARSSVAEIDETIATLGFDFGVTESTRRMDLRLRSNIDYFDYLDDTFDAEWIGGLSGLATLHLIEERLDWEIRDNLGQQLVDPLSPSRPGNRENVNFFATGPTLRLFSSTRNPVRLDARYSRVSYEERPFDNDRLSGALSVGRDTSRDTTISLNMTAERIEFDDDSVSPPIDQREAFVRFEKTGLRNNIALDFGYNEVEYGGQEGDGVLARIRWKRQTSANGSLSVTGRSRYSDQGNIFRLYQEITRDLTETTDPSVVPTPFQNIFISTIYELETERHAIRLFADWNQDDYEGDQGVNRELTRIGARFQREVSRNFFAGLSVRFFRREFTEIDRVDDDLVLGVNAGYRVSPGFSITLDYQNAQRDSSDVGADYSENRAFLRIAYVPVWAR